MNERCLVVTLVVASLLFGFTHRQSRADADAAAQPSADSAVDFNRDVRPILTKNCFVCHGQDENNRQAGLRLDQRSSALSKLDDGEAAIVPGRPQQSELYRRITSEDEFTHMPPADSGHELTAAQIETLRRWIEQGADYAQHWAFVKPRRSPPPKPESVPDPQSVRDAARNPWPRNAIDNFILARLRRERLSPSPMADRYTLIRRLSLDLRGLPPTLDEVDAFVADQRSDAYERLVDRFLDDPAFGERWARVWLDLARFADSAGYGSDPLRKTIWRYRDWVIDAFNANMPYDEFTIEQLAGDLVPHPTLPQQVATAFHRNTMTNTEGGTDDEEFRVAAVKDRVDTTVQVWMGLTMGCAKCHDHKYDPITQREYYQFFAYFNQTADTDQPDESPTIPASTPEIRREIERIDSRIAELRHQLDTPTPELAAAQTKWEAELRQAAGSAVEGRYLRLELPGKNRILSLAEVQVVSDGKNIAAQGAAKQSSTDYGGEAQRAIDGNTDGHYFNAHSTTHTKVENDPWWELDLRKTQPIERVVVWNRTDGNLESRLANFRVIVLDESRKTAAKLDVAEPPDPQRELTLSGPRSAVPQNVLSVIDAPPEQRSETDKQTLAKYYRSVASSLEPIRQEIARLEKSKPNVPQLPVMQELPPDKRRKTSILIKGNFLSKGDEVEPGVPHAFHSLPSDAPRNRLGVALWLVDEDNPLTARVAVNRFWGRLFGKGLVETEEDFGTQGEPPSHPKLLDWLATEFMRRDWNIKAMLRLMVTSATYRQSSRVTPELLAKDPRNRLLSRGPRHRLEAEMVRDQALAVSGLLCRKIGGPSVYPPQPPGLWRAAFNGRDRTWPTSEGPDRYRRGLYTFWRRTVPYPAMDAFDAPSREVCTVRRISTNTPLQAFVTLNDPAYVEMAQALARRIVREGGSATEDRARYALRLCWCRPPEPQQVQEIVKLFHSEQDHYAQHPQEAEQLATEPLGPLPDGMTAPDVAAWTVVANVLLNTDAVLSKN